MKVELNGEPRELPDGATRRRRGAREPAPSTAARGVAVAVDGEVVPRGAWERRALPTASSVEVLAAIQGGAADRASSIGGRELGARG